MKFPLALVLSLCVFGCQNGDVADSADSSDSDLNYYSDIKPILDAHCVSCHTEGEIGGFPLNTFEEVNGVRNAVAAAIESGSMPPWKPSADCNDYLFDSRLPQELVDTVVQWVESGAPEGLPDLEGQPIEGPGEGQLSRIDHSISMRAAYTPKKSPDDYRCFLIDWPYEQDNYVTGYTVDPDNAALVHHVIAFIAEPGSVAAYEAADAAEEGEGWTCYGGPGAGVSVEEVRWLGSWAPGGQTGDFPEGTGIPMQAGSKLVLQVHMNTSETATESALVSMDVSVEEEVERPAKIQPWTNPRWVFGQGMDIPPNTDNVTHEWGYILPSTYAFKVHTVALHMHTFGKSARLFVDHEDGTQTCLLDIDDWDFDWQRSYKLMDSVTLVEGDKLSISCTWDNPTDEEIKWGEGTGDEMCLGTMFVTNP
jgi:hypothetical protein